MKTLLFSLFLILLSACGKKEEAPQYVWSEERFTEVLTEFQLAEAVIRLGYHRSGDSLILNDSIYNAVFKHMNITREEFDSNYSYYLNNPKKLEHIYTNVITNLSERAALLKKVDK